MIDAKHLERLRECPEPGCDWGQSMYHGHPENGRGPELDRRDDLILYLRGLIEHLREDHDALWPGEDPAHKSSVAI